MGEQFEFLSAAWVAAVRSVLEELLAGADLTGIDFTISEQVTDPPAGRPDALGWYLRIRAGRLEVGDAPVADADFRMLVDYDVHHELARRVWDGDQAAMAESSALRAQATAAGKLRMEGDFAAAPELIRNLIMRLHDPVARLTA